jgi:hypothetical protein
MKLFNFLKKDTKNVTSANVEALSKNQLEKVIGGIDNSTIIASANAVKPPKGKSSTGATTGGA